MSMWPPRALRATLLIACSALLVGRSTADEGASLAPPSTETPSPGNPSPDPAGQAPVDPATSAPVISEAATSEAASSDRVAANASPAAAEPDAVSSAEATSEKTSTGAGEPSTTTAVDGPASIASLQALIEEADRLIARFDDEIEGYSCLLIKRERINGALSPHQYVWMKVREPQEDGEDETIPFGIYLKYLKPRSLAGREVLFVEGERSGDMLVRKGGILTPYVTVRIDPLGSQAQQASRYPITRSGLRFLTEELRARMEKEIQHANCEVREYADAKLGGRLCRHIVVRHPERHPDLDFSSARVFLDEELGLPVYFAAYGWPEKEEGDPPLLEEFLFTRIKLNPGFTAEDFQEANDAYGFQITK